MKSAQVYSVFDYRTGTYDYYQAPLIDLPASGEFRAPRTVAGVVVPETLAAKVPPGAQHVGKGEHPKGLIASHLGEVSTSSGRSSLFVGGLVLLASALWFGSRR